MTAKKVQIVEEDAAMYGLKETLAAIEVLKRTWRHWKNNKVDYEEKHS